MSSTVASSPRSYFEIPEVVVPVIRIKPILVERRTMKAADLEVDWVPYNKDAQIRGKMTIFVHLMIFYTTSLYYILSLTNLFYGKPLITVNEYLGETLLTKAVCVQWLAMACYLFYGVAAYRKIRMPTYLFLSVLATLGTFVLTLVKFRQFQLGMIPIYDITLNLLGVLLFCALIHNTFYVMVLWLHFANQKSIRQERREIVRRRFISVKPVQNVYV